ncbi:MAG: hypothetical protein AAF485_20980 [Chloroflexota bacterium]
MIHRAEIGKQVAAIKLTQITQLTLTPAHRPLQLKMEQTIDEETSYTRLTCTDTQIEQMITVGDQTETLYLDIPSNYGLFFPPVSAHGFILNAYDREKAGRQTVSLVSLRIRPEGALPLSAEIQPVEYEYIKDTEVETPAGQFACQHFIRYDQHMAQDLWLDAHGITIQWTVPYSPIMKWDYLLRRYQRTH